MRSISSQLAFALSQRRDTWLRVLKLSVSTILVIVLIRAAHWPDVLRAMRQLDPTWLTLALLLFIPQTWLSSWRWKELIRSEALLSLGESLRHTLASNAFNLIMPAKTGDFTKAAWARLAPAGSRVTLGRRVVLEKLADVGCLLGCIVAGQYLHAGPIIGVTCIVVLAGVLIYDRSGGARQKYLGPTCATFGLWTLHLLQIHGFLLAAGVSASLGSTLVRVPIALFSGLVPGTFCGFGTRDSMLVWLYADVAPAATMAVVGLLTALRYLVPGAAGIVVLLASRRGSIDVASPVPSVSGSLPASSS